MRRSLTGVLLILGLWLGAGAWQLATGTCPNCRDDDCAADHGTPGPDHHEAGHCPTPNACSCCLAHSIAAPPPLAMTSHRPESRTIQPQPPRALDGREAAPPLQRPPIA